ncbi:MAG: sulfur oxidation c-type cytochrome SoxX [Cohaesibacter sp.]|nr:sulfur oxidation c-type cytochrome SoxX [Cohaesibacter sp.]
MNRPVLALFCLLVGTSAGGAGTIKPADVQFSDGAVAASLTGAAGNVQEGRKVFISRKLGNCLACHANEDMAKQQFHGEVGPSLDGVADRWDEAQLRGILINSKETFEGTIMPAFYVDGGFARTKEKFKGKTILSAQQLEDVLAYLVTLKEQ